jgi:hypothetical protein
LAGEGEKTTFAELLRRRLHNSHDTAATQCPDAAILAAYYERALPAAEREGWETHFAACSRCRAGLAAMARATAADRPPARTNASPGWKMRIPAPIAAAAIAAVAVGVIVIVRALSSRPAAVTELASSTRSQTATRDDTGPVTRLARATPTMAERALALNQPSNRREALQTAAPPATAAKSLRAEVSSVAPAPAVAPPVPVTDSTTPQLAAGGAARTGGAPASPGNALESKSLAVPSAAGAAAAIGGAVTGARDATVGKSKSAEAGPAEATAIPGATTIAVAPPDHSVVWMVGAHGAISRLVTGGGVATPQRSGVAADLTAGSAPSSSVCWVVGRTGVITRTVDGEHWARVSSPTSADLAGVSAQSASDATIIAAGGQRYATTDGGVNWRPL